jgi:dihydropteroate synthase
MAHNVLILSSSALPSGRSERRRLGLPASRAAAGGAMLRPAHRVVRIEEVPPAAAARLGRAFGAAGGRAAALDRDGRGTRTLLLLGDERAFDRLLRVPSGDRPDRRVEAEIAAALRHRERPAPALRLKRGRLTFGGRTRVMGILNLTPDSFSDGGRFADRRAALEEAQRMAEEGADIIDVGGESTRPGARPVALAEELRRVVPLLEELVPRLARRERRTLVSIDTTKSAVARRAAAIGVDLVNDISGLGFDAEMPAVLAETGLPVVISHIRGRPETMQRSPRYGHLLPEIAGFLRRRIALAVAAGVAGSRIVVDPGIGFGKRRRDNLAILKHLAALRSLGRPLLVGLSRKSFIGGTLELPAEERLEGSLAAQALAIAGGADIIRAHDVREAVRVARLCDAVLRDVPRRDHS